MTGIPPDSDPVHFITTETRIGTPPLLPEIKLYLASEVTPLWEMTEERLNGSGLPPPYWAIAWAGGQGLTRYILDHPELVKGKRVVDFAAGCGMASIAVMMAGGKEAMAVDIDGLALESIKLNAAMNNVTVDTYPWVDMEKPPKGVDLIVAGDVCYQQAMAASIMRWLWLCVNNGIRVIMADPGRAYVPHDGLKEIARYKVPVSRDIEEQDERTVIVWELVRPT